MRRLIARFTAAVAAFRSTPAAPEAPASAGDHTDNAVNGDVHGTVIQAGRINTLDQSRHQHHNETHEHHVENQNIGVQAENFTGIGHLSGTVSAPIVFGNSGPVSTGGGTQINGGVIHTGVGHQTINR